jgi:hypothetical protein
MKGCTLIVIALMVICVTRVSNAFPTCSEQQTNDANKQGVLLIPYLAELGRTYNCFFTAEEAWEDNDPMNKVESYLVPRPARSEGLRWELERLRQIVPNFTFEIDKGNPRIVHVMDTRLARQKGYGLDGVLKNIDFSGNINDLVVAISKQGVSISPPALIDTHEGMFQDFTTVVQVKGKSMKVRDALSNFIPLNGRGMILWIARTKIGPGETSYIQFRGSQKKG